jgi:hypothetical protein
MPDSDASTEAGGVEAHDGPAVSDAVRSTEWYETEDGVVFYDSENPLAWLQSDHTVELDSVA